MNLERNPGHPGTGSDGGPEAPVPDVPLEIEWQFEAPDLDGVEAWLQSPEGMRGFQLGPGDTVRQHDRYFDTGDGRIFRADYAFRIRERGGEHEACLKSLTPPRDGLTVRREIAQPAEAPSPEGLFLVRGPVSDRLRLLATSDALRVLADLRTLRRRHAIQRDGTQVGELALDRTTLGDESGPAEQIFRVEVEVRESAAPELRPFVDRLRTEAGLTPAVRSKFEWALEATGKRLTRSTSLGPTEVLPDMTLGEAGYAVLRKHFLAMIRHEPGTRLGEDPEHLHDMRVATRRMRATLRIFSEAFRVRERDRLQRELRGLGRVLGAVRDLDVQLEQVRGSRDSLITVEPAALDPFLRILAERREEARRELLAYLESSRYRGLVHFLRECLREGPPRRPMAGIPIRSAAPDLVRKARKRVMRRGRVLGGSSAAEDYHRLRILVKRWRYTLEFLAPVYGRPMRPLIASLVRLQDILGLHQDAQVLMEELHSMARREAQRLPEAARFAVGELAQLLAAQRSRQRDRFPKAFAKVEGRRWKEAARAMEAAEAELAAELLAHRVARARKATRAAGRRKGRGSPGSEPGSGGDPVG